MHMDSRIGLLTSGKYYAFVDGYDKPETVGTREEVERALGLHSCPSPILSASKVKLTSYLTWCVKLTFQYPAWDEVNGIEYRDIEAQSKSFANAVARRQAMRDGHLFGGKGRARFVATPQEDFHA